MAAFGGWVRPRPQSPSQCAAAPNYHDRLSAFDFPASQLRPTPSNTKSGCARSDTYKNHPTSIPISMQVAFSKAKIGMLPACIFEMLI